MRRIVKQLAVLCFCGFLSSVTPAAQPAPAIRQRTAIVLDTSGSMETRLEALKQGAKLAIALLDGEVVIIPFSDRANAHTFDLSTHAGRRAAMAFIDSLGAHGGTDYVRALELWNKLPKGSPCIFVSDGEHNGPGGEAAVFAELRNAPGPVHTVAVNAPEKARRLLFAMSAKTAGSAGQVEHAEDLTTRLIDIARGLAHYRSYEPGRDRVDFANVQAGEWIGIGYGSPVGIMVIPAIRGHVFQHLARLGGKHVHLVRFTVEHRSDVTLHMPVRTSAADHLGRVLRQGLPVAQTRFTTVDGKIGAGSSVDLTTQFLDAKTGKPLDIAGHPGFSAEYVIKDMNGQVLERAQATAQGKELVAKMTAPRNPGPAILEATTSVKDGADFKETSQFAWEVAKQAYLGIAVNPALRDFGAHVAGAGRVELGTIALEGRDRDALAYGVTVDALANTAGALPTFVSPDKLMLEAGRPGAVLVSADITDVSPGDYLGKVHVQSAAGTWSIPFRILVKAALRAAAVEPVTLAPGQVGKRRIVVRNDGKAPLPLHVQATPLAVKGGSIELTLPEQIKLNGQAETGFDIQLAVSPLVTSRGVHETTLLLKRGPIELSIPVKVCVVADGGERLNITPGKIELTGKPDSVVRFDLLVKPAGQAITPDKAYPSAGNFRSDALAPTEVVVAFQEKVARLGPDGVSMTAFVVLPRRTGIYSGVITIDTDRNGKKQLSLSLIVK